MESHRLDRLLGPVDPGLGEFHVIVAGPLVAGSQVSMLFTLEVGQQGVNRGGAIRVGLPNTGWDAPTVP